MRLWFALFLAATLFSGASEPTPQALAISYSPERSQVEVIFRSKRVLLYTFATNQFKPYVKELYTLSGQNVLRDSPADHLHHHGLMYAIRVNGVNFWEEVGEPGHEISGAILSHSVSTNSSGQAEATFAQLIYWVDHTNAVSCDPAKVALLTEKRTISVKIDERRDEVAVDWRGNFQVGATSVKLTGSFYNGLGLRLPESFDHIAYHQNSEDLPYSVEQERDVTAARWSAVTGLAEKRAATVAIFDAPHNPGETRFYTMLNPFAYLSVTQNLEKKPLDYRPGDRFAIRYLVAVYGGSRDGDFLEPRYREWLCAQQKSTK